jgi:tetratricopeptide (TPR) repeat protein
MKQFMRIHVKWLLRAVLLTLLTGTGLHAQSYVHYNAALNFIQKGEVDSAKKQIDLHMQDVSAQADPESWYLRGFVYKEMYKKYENAIPNSAYRQQALDYFTKSIELDTVATRIKVTRDNVRYLAGRFYNDAVTTLDTVNHATSIICYENYRKAVLIADPNLDIRKKDVEFYLALASTYNTIYNLDKKKNAIYFDKARDTYMKVIAIDQNNYTANFNLSLLFWNRGVDIMYEFDYDADIDSVSKAQDQSVALFKQSLPFAEKALEIEPLREETLIVLSGIYLSLNDFEKSKKFQEMLEELKK